VGGPGQCGGVGCCGWRVGGAGGYWIRVVWRVGTGHCVGHIWYGLCGGFAGLEGTDMVGCGVPLDQL